MLMMARRDEHDVYVWIVQDRAIVRGGTFDAKPAARMSRAKSFDDASTYESQSYLIDAHVRWSSCVGVGDDRLALLRERLHRPPSR